MNHRTITILAFLDAGPHMLFVAEHESLGTRNSLRYAIA
jgi:hypothetical protein